MEGLAMAFIPQNVIDEVVARNDITSVISDYVQLERKGGANLFGLCPFHAEKTPSFSVNSSENFFYCFGCHEGGNVIKFIQKIENLNFPDAVQFLAKRVGMEIELDESPEAKKRQDEYKLMLKCLLDAARFFYRSFKSPAGREAENYLYNKRRLSQQVVTSFGIGYALEDWESLNNHLLSLGYSQSLILKLGLSRKSNRGSYYDFFRDRIMFPIFDHLGQLRAFGGRIMGQGEAKYINSPDSPVYNKGRYLYALNFARKERSDELILCEGYMDTISMHEAGFKNSVAGLGTALTREQARLLSQYTDKVILAYDSDQAGRAAALKALAHLEREHLESRVLLLPDGSDPDDYIHSYGRERFAALLEAALPALDFRLLLARNEASTEQGSLDVITYQDKATDILADIDNAVVRELYSDKVAKEIRISPASILQVIEQKRRGEKQVNQPAPRVSTASEFKLEGPALIYLTGLLDDNEIIDQQGLEVENTYFQQEIQELMSYVLQEAKNKRLNVPTLLNLIEEYASDLKLEEKILPYFAKMRKSEMRTPQEYAQEAVQHLKINRLEERKIYLLAKIMQTNEQVEKEKILTQINQLNQVINELK